MTGVQTCALPILYLIIGTTHPKTLKLEGEKYRNFLKTKAKELGVENNIKFINKYLLLDELFQHLKASDIYLCSILNEKIGRASCRERV